MTRIPRGAARFKWRRQRQEKSRRWPTLNLVALMDVFTILVFFLLVNSSDGEVLPTHKSVDLPESVAEAIPRQTLVIMITASDIMIHGKVITSIESVLDDSDNATSLLQAALQSTDTRNKDTDGKPARREATIMGDKEIPYRIIKKVMASCTAAGFARISLAVLQKPPGEG